MRFIMWMRRSKRYRARAAGILAVLYALCVLAPAAAFALSDAAHASHCLTHDHHAAGAGHDHADALGHVHIHGDGSSHEHATPDDSHSKASSECCGLFCLTALPTPLADLGAWTSFGASTLSTATADHAGRGPDRLYRPPISFLRS
jgi:hypothetical protein